MSLGSRTVGSAIDVTFDTRSAGILTTLIGGVISVYKNNSPDQSTAGITLTPDFDGRVGTNQVHILTGADPTFYTADASYTIMLTAGTVAGASVAGLVIDDFYLTPLVTTTVVTPGLIPVVVPGQVTFESVWRIVLGHCPLAGPALVREWTQWAYNEICRERNAWSHLRTPGTLIVTDARTGTVSVTRGLPAVAPGTLTFSSADLGRQIKFASSLYYTVVSVDSGIATVDRPIGEAGTLSATVLDAYLVMPADFARFYAVIDPSNQRRLRFDIPSDRVDRMDPTRTSSGTPFLLANASLSPVAATYGQVRYELYPAVQTARAFPCYYYRGSEILSDDSALPGALANQKDVLVEGALSRCALWPGVDGKRNLYFSLPLAKVHEEKFRDKVIDLHVGDDEVYFEAMPEVQFTFADWPGDSAWLQSHVPDTIG
jgi:hypothetical protein